MRELIYELKSKNIYVSVEDNELVVDFEGDHLPDELIQRIKDNKQLLMEYLRKYQVNEDYRAIPKIPISESYAISDAQRRLWVLSQFDDSSVAYNIPGTIELKGDYNHDLFQKAFDSLIERHEILRTVFKEDEAGEVRQFVLSKDDLNFQVGYKDFCGQENAKLLADTFIREDTYKRYDLESGPLLRGYLIKIEEGGYIFYYNMHHIISDDWSVEILFRDLFTFYEAAKANKTVELEALRIQYKDYSAWQLDQFRNNSLDAHKSFWTEKLSGNLPVIDLPSSKQRPKMKTYNGRVVGTYIDSQTAEGLKQFSQENGGSLFMGLLATWNVLLYTYTGQRDIVLGTPVAGRDHTDLEDQIGFYINTLALANKIKPEESFKSFFTELKENTLVSFKHQMYPFDRLIDELDLRRDTSRSPIFDISITFHSMAEGQAVTKINDEIVNEISDRGVSKVKNDIELHFRDEGSQISSTLIFNTDVYELKMIEGLLLHYKQLVKNLLENPDQVIAHVDYLSNAEKVEQLVNFNNTQVDYPKDKTLVNLFEEQVAKTPKNVAVTFEGNELTYEELNDRSNQLAAYLRENYRIAANQLVGIQLDRSEWMIISILGVLKAGGAYVPIDPEYPDLRKKQITEDSAIEVLITSSSFIYDIEYFEGVVFAIDLEFEPENYEAKNVSKLSTSDDLAYVIYTSGSTGKPKGVMVQHRAIVNTVLAQIDAFELTSEQCGLQFASFSFDASISETFITLLSGGKLAMVSEKTRKDPKEFITFINTQQVDIATLPPSYLHQLEMDELKGLKKLITAGEAANYQKAIEFIEYGTYFNAYGPTETSICASIFRMEKGNSMNEKRIPIGRPIANSQIYILNENGQLLPKGVPGEICVSGDGLAKGYLNEEELTNEKFIDHPFKTGERLYRTGDIGKWLNDGSLDILGRIDDQVKIRGYRIELAEIEKALLANRSIEQALVVAREDQEGSKELVAYVTSKEEQTANSLEAHLKGILPGYMVPGFYVQLSEFPLTPNGKINKKELPAPEGVATANSDEYVAPRNETEEKLVRIWEEVLQKENIGVLDDFFALGGHSLKAMKLVSEYNKEFNAQIPLQDLFVESKLCAHAEMLDIQHWIKKDSDDPVSGGENTETIKF